MPNFYVYVRDSNSGPHAYTASDLTHLSNLSSPLPTLFLVGGGRYFTLLIVLISNPGLKWSTSALLQHLVLPIFPSSLFLTGGGHAILITFIFSGCGCGHAHTTAYMWRSEDNLWQLSSTMWAIKLGSRHLYPLSYLTGPIIFLIQISVNILFYS